MSYSFLFRCFVCAAITIVASSSPCFSNKVRGYSPLFSELYGPDGRLAMVAIRGFHLQDGEYRLAVDPLTMRTAVVPAARWREKRSGLDELRRLLRRLPYFRAIAAAEQNRRVIQNAGITRLSSRVQAVYVTADLCPSRRPLDRRLIQLLLDAGGGDARPVPIALCVSGRWMDKHKADLDWLIEREKKHEIAVTWVNHSYHHRCNKKGPWRSNFMLMKGTKVEEEVLTMEARMIERGIVPSVFFRFPGLISDEALVRTIIGYGLIPLGADAWLGKKHMPSAGSIILVHANGEEPVGIDRLNTFLRSRKNGQPPLRDIRDGFAECFAP